MKIFEQLGRVALGTRVRFLGDRITEDAAKIYELYGIEMNPKWFPVFYVLSQNDQKTITSIAEDIGHSHVSVSKIVAEMVKARFVTEKTSTEDRSRTMVSLTKAGKESGEHSAAVGLLLYGLSQRKDLLIQSQQGQGEMINLGESFDGIAQKVKDFFGQIF